MVGFVGDRYTNLRANCVWEYSEKDFLPVLDTRVLCLGWEEPKLNTQDGRTVGAGIEMDDATSMSCTPSLHRA